jgi:hypothetical protein
MKMHLLHSDVWGVDAFSAVAQNDRLISPFASVGGREAGFLQPASASLEKESAEWLFSPRPGQGSPTLGANRCIPKKRHPAFAGRRAGDAITGGVMANFYKFAPNQSSTKSAFLQPA